MKNTLFTTIIALFSLLLFSGCATVKVSSDFDKKTDFAQYKSFAFHQKGIEKLKLNDLDKKRILTSIENELIAKGLTKSNENADLIVNVLAASKDEININQNPFWGGWGWGLGPWGPWGGMNNTSVSRYTSGTIIIDLVDNKRNILVWQGQGAGLNVSNVSKKAERIPKAIQEIMAKYPPYSKS